MGLPRVVSARIAHGAAALPAAHYADESVICWWHPRKEQVVWTAQVAGTLRINLKGIAQGAKSPWDEWPDHCVMQFLQMDHSTVEEIQQAAPEVPHLGGTHLPGMERTRWVDLPTRVLETPGPTIEEIPTSPTPPTTDPTPPTDTAPTNADAD